MSGVRIVTDSACDLTDEEVTAAGIEVVSLSIRFGSDEYIDRTELSVADFYAKMAASEHLPETAAPAPGAFVTAFEKLADDGATEIVCINISAALSATMQSAENAAIAVAERIKVHVFDSESITGGLGAMALAAAEAGRDGASADDILAMLADMRERTRVYGALDTLENLKKGGRIGGASAMIGTMLSIKPLVDLSSGSTEEAGRQRTRKKAMGWLRDKVVEAGKVENLSVIHGQAADIDIFLNMLSEHVDIDDVRVVSLGAVIGAHGGPGVIGVTYLVSA